MNECNVENRTIFCHDNLEVLQGINDECIDLIYLDPPFNKNKKFSAPIGSDAEGAEFKDWFREEDVKDEWLRTIKEDNLGLHNFLHSVKSLVGIDNGKNYYLFNYCYLCYMAIRLIEMERILKDTGSIYLHCDPTMSHYIKIMMDLIFGEKNFRNEIIWCYSGPGKVANAFTRKHDTIYFFSKSNSNTFNTPRIKHKSGVHNKGQLFGSMGKGTIEKQESMENEGKRLEDWWADIYTADRVRKERTGYPTQKPLALLERIIKASTNEGDVVLDPFCGCATTCVAAEKHNRKWIGIDISLKAFDLVQLRVKKEVKKDLFDMNKKHHPEIKPPKRTDDGDGRDKKFVYIISHPLYRNQYKVGIAKSTKARLNSYQTADPNRAYKLVFEHPKSNFRATEDYIHEKYDNNYEWVKGNLHEIKEDIINYDKGET